MIYPIVLYGDPILKKKAADIPFKEDISELINDMFETMRFASGVGLAAPQIGKALRLFIVDSTPMEENKGGGMIETFINPQIVDMKGDPWAFEEGCLSIPGIREDISREAEVTIKYYNANWEAREQTFDDIRARIILHEYDHIEGILFTDYLSAFKKRLLKGKLSNISKGKVDVDYKVKAAQALKR